MASATPLGHYLLEFKALPGRAVRTATKRVGGWSKAGGSITDSLGRKWTSDLHPRDSRGRFIEVGGVGRVFGRGQGKVLRVSGRDTVEVQFTDGTRDNVQAKRLTMIRRPDGSSPTKSRTAVLDEDEKREQDPNRGTAAEDENPDLDANGIPDDEEPEDVDDEDADDPGDDDEPAPAGQKRTAPKPGDLLVLSNPRGRQKLVDFVGRDQQGAMLYRDLGSSQTRKLPDGIRPGLIRQEDVDRNALRMAMNDYVNPQGEPATSFGDQDETRAFVAQFAKQQAPAVPDPAAPAGPVVGREEGRQRRQKAANMTDEALQAEAEAVTAAMAALPPGDEGKKALGRRLKALKTVMLERGLTPPEQQPSDGPGRPQAAPQAPAAPVTPDVVPQAPSAPRAPLSDEEVDRRVANSERQSQIEKVNESSAMPAERAAAAEQLMESSPNDSERDYWRRQAQVHRDQEAAGFVPNNAARDGMFTDASRRDPDKETQRENERIVAGADREQAYRDRTDPMRPVTEYGPDYNRTVADRLTTADRLHKQGGRDEEVEYHLGIAEQAFERSRPASAPEPEEPSLDEEQGPSDADLAAVEQETDPLDGPYADEGDLTALSEDDLRRLSNAIGRDPNVKPIRRSPMPGRPDLTPAEFTDGGTANRRARRVGDEYERRRDERLAERERNGTSGIVEGQRATQPEPVRRTPDELATEAAPDDTPEVYKRLEEFRKRAEAAEAEVARALDADAPTQDDDSSSTPTEEPTDDDSDGSAVRGDDPQVLGDVPADGDREDEPERPDAVLPGPRRGRGGGDRGRDAGEPARVEPAGRQSSDDGTSAGDRSGAGTGGSVGGDGVPAEGAGDRGQGDADLPAVVAAAERGVTGQSFRPSSGADLAGGSGVDQKQRARENLAALQTLRKLQAEGRTEATADEQAVMAKWGGMGAIRPLFTKANKDADWKKLRDDLRALVPDDAQWEALKDNAANAHYTDYAIVDSMWGALERLGFERGNVLEPGSGLGNFIFRAPGGATVHGVEVEPITAAISQMLSPQAKIRNESFGRTRTKGLFDAAIGNVPFGNYRVYDKDYNPKLKKRIHDHFSEKALASVKPGGVMAMVTSAGTMDKGNREVREEIYKHSDLIGMVRLPNGAHRDAAGTEVATDVMLFRVRKPGEAPGDASWLGSSVRTHSNGEPVTGTRRDEDGNLIPQTMNDYYLDHPENILGEVVDGGFNHIAVEGDFDPDALREALDSVVEDARLNGRDYNPDAPTDGPLFDEAAKRLEPTTITPERPAGAVGDNLLREPSQETLARRGTRLQGSLTHVGTWKRTRAKKANAGGALAGSVSVTEEHQFSVVDANGSEILHVPSEGERDELARLLRMRDLHEDLVFLEKSDEDDTPQMEALRKELSDAYDAYVKVYGPIGRVKVGYRKMADKQAEKYQAGLDAGEDPDPDVRPRADGGFETVSRTPPGMGGMRVDPSFWNLLALEGEYDEGSPDDPNDWGTATRGDILSKRQLRPYEPPQTADDPDDALTIVEEKLGRIDLEEVARVLGLEGGVRDAMAVLGDRVLKNHKTGEWVKYRSYISKINLRETLRELQDAVQDDPSLQRNIDMIVAAMPADKKIKDIQARLGANWMPTDTFQDFMRETVGGYAASRIKLKLDKDDNGRNLWTIDGHGLGDASIIGGDRMSDPRPFEERSPNHPNFKPLVAKYGTSRMPFTELVGHALNNSVPTVYDTRTVDGRDVKILNAPETEAAKDMLVAVQNQFAMWLRADPDRAAKLERIYNDRYRSRVPANYINSPDRPLPGMNAAVVLDQHQIDGVTRGIEEDAMGAAWEVGVGKTFLAGAVYAERKRLGKSKKTYHTTPNHLVEQTAREFKHLYPDMKILVVDGESMKSGPKGDSERIRRRTLSQVRDGDWDVVIASESADARILPSLKSLLAGKREQLAKLQAKREKAEDDGKQDLANATTGQIKDLEASIEKDEVELTTDNPMDFTSLGFDYIGVDESHRYKNDLVFGGPPNFAGRASKRAQNLRAKIDTVRALNRENGGDHGVLLLSGTPVTNNTREFYVNLRMLRPDLLEEAGVADFDDFYAQFLESEEDIEGTVYGGTQMKVRDGFKLVNAGELVRMWQQGWDVVKAADVGIERPKLKGDAMDQVVIPMSVPLERYYERLWKRYQGRPKKWKLEKGDDNALAIGNDGLMAAIDMRLLPDKELSAIGLTRGQLTDDDGKIGPLADKVIESWNNTKNNPYQTKKGSDRNGNRYPDHPNPGALQLIFSDVGVPGGNSQSGFNLYEAIKSRLVRDGMSLDEVAFIHDAADKATMKKLTDKARSGEIKVLIGSSAKMATGLNVQDRLTNIWHIDTQKTPDVVEQRNGRGIRRGNQNAEIGIGYITTEGTAEAWAWSVAANKDNFLREFDSADMDSTVIGAPEDSEAAPLTTLKASASKDPYMIEQAKAKKDAQTLERSYSIHQGQIESANGTVLRAGNTIDGLNNLLTSFDRALEGFTPITSGDQSNFLLKTPDGQTYAKLDAAAEVFETAVRDSMTRLPHLDVTPWRSFASLGGQELSIRRRKHWTGRQDVEVGVRDPLSQESEVMLPGGTFAMSDIPTGKFDSQQAVRLRNLVNRLPNLRQNVVNTRADQENALAQARETLAAPDFERMAELEAARNRKDTLDKLARLEMGSTTPIPGETLTPEQRASRLAALKEQYAAAKDDFKALHDEWVEANGGVKASMKLGAEKRSRRDSQQQAADRMNERIEASGVALTKVPRKTRSLSDEELARRTAAGVRPAKKRPPAGGDQPAPVVRTADDLADETGVPTEDGSIDLGADDTAATPDVTPEPDVAPVPNEGAGRPTAEDLAAETGVPVDELPMGDVTPEPESDEEAPADQDVTPDAAPENAVEAPDDDDALTPATIAGDGPGPGFAIPEAPTDEPTAAPEPDAAPDDVLDDQELADALAATPPTRDPALDDDAVTIAEAAEPDAVPAQDDDEASLDEIGDTAAVEDDDSDREADTDSGAGAGAGAGDGDDGGGRDGGDPQAPDDLPDPDADRPEADRPDRSTLNELTNDGRDDNDNDSGPDGPRAPDAGRQDSPDVPRIPDNDDDSNSADVDEPPAPAEQSEQVQDLADTIGETDEDAPAEEALPAQTDEAAPPVDEPASDEWFAQALEGEDYPPTPQQSAIHRAALAGRRIIAVIAKAGTGKTTTLQALARRFAQDQPNKKIGYGVFNASTAAEAVGKMPRNVDSVTSHALAYRWSDGKYGPRAGWRGKTKKDGMLAGIVDLRDHFGVRGDIYRREGRPLSTTEQAVQARNAVAKFASSADDTILPQHFAEGFETIDAAGQKRLLDLANRMWTDLNDLENGRMKVTPDHIRKAWALARPDFTQDGWGFNGPIDVLMVDEAQDTAPVWAKVVEDQSVQKIIVGDPDQAINAFTGAINYLQDVVKNADDVLPLSNSFRYGPHIAAIGNRFLSLLGSDTRGTGAGRKGGSVLPTGTMTGADAVLTRSNAGMVEEIVREADDGRLVGLTEGTKQELLNLVNHARYLQGTAKKPERKDMAEDLEPYSTWKQVEEAAEEGTDTKAASFLRTIKKAGGLDSLEDLIGSTIDLGGGLANVDIERDPNKMVLSGVGTLSMTKAIKSKRGGESLSKHKVGEGTWRFNGKDKTWVFYGNGADQEAALAEVREWTGADGPKPDVIVSTAHKSKGLEWDRVRIASDFKGPKRNAETGELEGVPDADELMLGYVAVTRAAKDLDPGSLSWIYDATEDADESTDLPGQRTTPPPAPNTVDPDELRESLVAAGVPEEAAQAAVDEVVPDEQVVDGDATTPDETSFEVDTPSAEGDREFSDTPEPETEPGSSTTPPVDPTPPVPGPPEPEPEPEGEVRPPLEEPEDVNGQRAQWVPVTALQPGDTARVIGIDQQQRPQERAGYVQGVEELTVARKRRGRAQMIAVTLSENQDGTGETSTTLVSPNGIAAQAINGTIGEPEGEGAPRSLPEIEVLDGTLPEAMPQDSQGNTIWPGSEIEVGGEPGTATAVTPTTVEVNRPNDSGDEPIVSPSQVTVTDGGAARPEGWSEDGTPIRPGDVVQGDDGPAVVTDVDGDDVVVQTPAGETVETTAPEVTVTPAPRPTPEAPAAPEVPDAETSPEPENPGLADAPVDAPTTPEGRRRAIDKARREVADDQGVLDGLDRNADPERYDRLDRSIRERQVRIAEMEAEAGAAGDDRPASPDPTTPVAPSSGMLDGAGTAITDNFYQGYFDALVAGDGAARIEPTWAAARAAYERGEITSPEDLRRFLSGQQSTPDVPEARPSPSSGGRITPVVTGEEYQRLFDEAAATGDPDVDQVVEDVVEPDGTAPEVLEGEVLTPAEAQRVVDRGTEQVIDGVQESLFGELDALLNPIDGSGRPLPRAPISRERMGQLLATVERAQMQQVSVRAQRITKQMYRGRQRPNGVMGVVAQMLARIVRRIFQLLRAAFQSWRDAGSPRPHLIRGMRQVREQMPQWRETKRLRRAASEIRSADEVDELTRP